MGTPMARLLRDVFFNWCQVVAILIRDGYHSQLKEAWAKAIFFIDGKVYFSATIPGIPISFPTGTDGESGIVAVLDLPEG